MTGVGWTFIDITDITHDDIRFSSLIGLKSTSFPRKEDNIVESERSRGDVAREKKKEEKSERDCGA